jgi:hypothetical protein
MIAGHLPVARLLVEFGQMYLFMSSFVVAGKTAFFHTAA